ncbi:MAG: efflux RND transporter permease subunit, partial [Chlamydiota bacterium]
MNLSAPFIKRPVMTILVMFALIFFGVGAYNILPVSDLPSVAYPTLVVTAGLPGGNPEVMANSVASPLEQAFLSVQGLKFMTSSSTPGQSQIVLQFNLDTDIGSAAADVNSQISATLSQLPKQMPSSPTYQKVNPADSPILYLRISSYTDPLGDLYEWAKTYIGERISLVEGVAQVIVYGSAYSPRVKIDPQVLASKGLDLSDINQVIQTSNVYIPVGTMDGVNRYYLFNIDGQVMNADGYNSLVYNTNNGAYGTIGNIGNTIDYIQNDKQISYFIKKDHPPEASVILAIKRIPGANTLKVNRTINKLLPELRHQIPGSVAVEPIFDRSGFIEEAVHDVEFTLMLSIGLVVVVIFICLGRVTDTLIPSIVLPITIIATFAVMYLLNFSIDTLSLMALTLAIGFVVDDAIVVLENIVRHTELGKEPFEAALEGSKQISVTVFTMTLALSIVFVPLIFLAGMLGRIFHEFAVTIAVSILISGVISLTLTPMLAARLVSKANRKSKLAEFAEALNEKMIGVYRPLLKKVLEWPKITLLGGLVALVMTFFIGSHMPSTLSVDDDLGFILGATQTSETFSSEKTTEHQLNLSPLFLNDPSVAEITSVCAQTSNTGLLFIKLNDASTRPPIGDIIHKFYPKLLAQPGINTYLRALPLLNLDAGAGSNSDYQYAFTSLDPQALHEGAKKITQALQKNPEFLNVNTDMLTSTPQLNMHLLRERASLLNISARAIENTLQYGYSMAQVSLINAPTDQFYVILETENSFQNDPLSLNQIMVKSTDNKLAYLKDLMEITPGVGSSSVNHINQLPSV